MRTELPRIYQARFAYRSFLRYTAVAVSLTLLAYSATSAQKTTQSAAKSKVIRIDQQSEWQTLGVKGEVVNYKGKPAVRVSDAAPTSPDGERVLWLSGTDFKNGAIEIEMTGEPGPNAGEQARGFVGLAFRAAAGGSHYECFYLRPTNGRAEDQVRRNHSVQYISYPDYPWEKLRQESPGKYESYCDLVPAEWTKVRIEAHGVTGLLYVNGALQPTLIVSDLKLGETNGGIGLWIGPGTIAHFANLRVSP